MAKRKIPVKNFLTNEDFQEFIEKEKEWIYFRVIEAIEKSFFEGSDCADIMEAKIADPMSKIQMKSEIYEWCNSLKLALKWFEKEENYEKCGEILKLIRDIEEYLSKS